MWLPDSKRDCPALYGPHRSPHTWPVGPGRSPWTGRWPWPEGWGRRPAWSSKSPVSAWLQCSLRTQTHRDKKELLEMHKEESTKSFASSRQFTCQLGHVRLRYPHHFVTSLDLLRDQRLGGSHEDDLPRRIPPVEVVHHHGGDEGLAQASGETHQRVLEEGGFWYLQLVLPDRKVGGVDPHLGRRAVKAWKVWVCLPTGWDGGGAGGGGSGVGELERSLLVELQALLSLVNSDQHEIVIVLIVLTRRLWLLCRVCGPMADFRPR